jgi:hypothetical protein
MAKRKKQPSKVQKRKAATARARKLTKVARGKATKRTVDRAKPKRARVKKAVKPVTVAVETIAVEGLSIPAPGVTIVTEVEEAATVLQLPAEPKTAVAPEAERRARNVACRSKFN